MVPFLPHFSAPKYKKSEKISVIVKKQMLVQMHFNFIVYTQISTDI